MVNKEDKKFSHLLNPKKTWECAPKDSSENKFMENNTDYSTWIGEKVSKTGATRKNRQPKPFKSGFKTNTVKTLCVNPNTGKPAFSFFEDDSVVDCHVCELISNEKSS